MTSNAEVRVSGHADRARGVRWLLPTVALGVLALTAALAGLLVEDVYTGVPSTAAMLRAYDLVTLAIVVPALMVAARTAVRGSLYGHLMTCSLIAYLVYTYAIYLFGTGFNDLFLLHVATFGTGLVALGLNIAVLDTDAVTRLGLANRKRAVAAILGAIGLALGGMWVYFALENAITGAMPVGSQLVETDTIVRLGMALDLTLLVPLYAVASVLLWRGSAWGFVLAFVAVFAGILHQVSYMVAMPFQVAADVSGAQSFDPGEPVIVIAYLAAALMLVSAQKPQ